MSWYNVTVGHEDLDQFLFKVRREGAKVAHYFPCADGFCVIYTAMGR